MSSFAKVPDIQWGDIAAAAMRATVPAVLHCPTL